MYRLLLRRLAGSIDFKCEREGFERLLSRALEDEIEVFDIKQGEAPELSVLTKDIKRIRRAAADCGCEITVKSRRGVFFRLLGLKGKTALASGLAALFVTVFLFGETVFVIDITGTSTVSRKELMSVLNEHGLRVGMWQNSVDTSEVIQGVMLDLDRLSWMTINLTFGKAEVMLTDKTASERKNTDNSSVIVAARDAQIKSIDVESGMAVAESGQVVTENEELVVAAPFHINNSWTRTVSATIIGYTSYTEVFEVEKAYQTTEKTGRTERKTRFRLYGREIPLYINPTEFSEYSKLEYYVPYELFGVELPAGRVVGEISELAAVTTELDRAAAEKILGEMQAEYERTQLAGKRILTRNAEISETETGYRCSSWYFCEENIGKNIQIE